MAVNRLSSYSLQSGFSKLQSIWDGRTAVGSMDVISAVTLTSSQATIDFTNIPQTYSHLHIRIFGRNTRSSENDGVFISFNNDFGTNYSINGMVADGTATPNTDWRASQNGAFANRIGAATALTNVFGGGYCEILDYSNSNKNTTVKFLGGTDTNFTSSLRGAIQQYISVWYNTSPVTSLTLWSPNGNFLANSTFTLYGVK